MNGRKGTCIPSIVSQETPEFSEWPQVLERTPRGPLNAPSHFKALWYPKAQHYTPYSRGPQSSFIAETMFHTHQCALRSIISRHIPTPVRFCAVENEVSCEKILDTNYCTNPEG